MLDAAGLAAVDKAPRQPIQKPNRLVGALQQQRTAVRADLSAVKPDFDSSWIRGSDFR
jgi:hypothetical protein